MFGNFDAADKAINICGLRCPEPIMVVRRTLRLMTKGQMLSVIADDPTTMRDIPGMCQFMGHILLAQVTEYLPYRYLLRKGPLI